MINQIQAPRVVSIGKLFAILIILVAASGCASFQPGQWYLHDTANKELADQAKNNWAPVQADLWQNLLKNQKITSDAELDAQRLLQASVATSHHIAMVNIPWKDVLSTLQTYKSKLIKQNQDLDIKKNKALENATEAGKRIAVLLQENATRDEAIKKASENIEAWEQKLQLFENAAKKFVRLQTDSPENADAFVKDIQQKALDIVSADDLKSLMPVGKLEDNPPGITLEILSLGADLAKAQLDREKAIQNRLHAEFALFATRKQEIKDAMQWITQAISELDAPLFKKQLDNTVFASIQNSLKANTSPNTEGFNLILQKCVLADDFYTLTDNTFVISEAALIHRYTIEDSAISAKQHEALITRGLDTLTAYHSGGITQEEINTILQAAQAIGLAVISAGVI